VLRIIFCGLGLALPFFASAQTAAGPREDTLLATWQFAEDALPTGSPLTPPAAAKWQPVTVPHVFRQSGLPDNAAGWYRTTIDVPATDRGRCLWLDLEGAASVKDVFVNGRFIGRHKGAFTAAAFDLTPAIKFGAPNVIAVRVSNRDDETAGMLARSVLYYVNGGMFRAAHLVKTGAVQIFPEMGSSGVFLTPGNITAASATLATRTAVRNATDQPVKVVVRQVVTAPDGTGAADFSQAAVVPASETKSVEAIGRVPRPELWDLGKPNLYTVRTEVLMDGRPTDAITSQTGFRTLAMHDRRIFLNGREVQLRGVNKHAQTETNWNAVSDDDLRADWAQIVELGVNAVRLAHYPHARLEYALADQQGVAVWAENGFAGHDWANALESDMVVTPDGERLTREMVRQNWNHPSILFWSVGNETVAAVADHYAEVVRAEKDPTRLITFAVAKGAPTGTDFNAHNTYEGWYASNYSAFSGNPKNDLVSETGAGDWITHHVPYGTFQWDPNTFEPEEYAQLFTEFRLQTIFRDAVATHPMFFWWSFREFYDRKFKQNRNTKGLLSLAGEPKDLFFLFQSFLRSIPVVHLDGRAHFLRRFAPDNGIKAYSNAARLTLTVNGNVVETKRNGGYHLPKVEKNRQGESVPAEGLAVDNVFFWKTPLAPGRNVIEVADGQGHADRMIVYQAPASGGMPADSHAIVRDLKSSNAGNEAVFIDRPVAPQSPFYSEVDGSSDNTFDVLPPAVSGAAWIATRRLSDATNKTDLSFRIAPESAGATVFVMFSTGTYPTVTLKAKDEAITAAAAALQKSLAAQGFHAGTEPTVWRDHQLERADAALWSRFVPAGGTVSIPGETLDYVVMVKPAKP
jgi:beta-galactosidase